MQPTIGKLKYSVEWYIPPTARDSAGQLTDYNPSTYTLLGTRKASIVSSKSMERLNEQPQAQSEYKITQRALAGLDATCQMRFKGTTYEITGISELFEVQFQQFQTITVITTALT